MNVTKKIASKYSGIVHLAVGLHCGFENAQRMSVKRRSIPD